MQIDVKIDDTGVKGFLKKLHAKMKDMTPVMRVIGEIVRSSVMKNFDVGGRPERWQPTRIRSIYAAYRGKGKRAYTLKGRLTKAFERHTNTRKTLIDTARLRNSITTRAYPDRTIVGSNVVYARIHQFGGKAGRGKKVTIPARPYLLVQDEDWISMRDALTGFLTEGVSQ